MNRERMQRRPGSAWEGDSRSRAAHVLMRQIDGIMHLPARVVGHIVRVPRAQLIPARGRSTHSACTSVNTRQQGLLGSCRQQASAAPGTAQHSSEPPHM